jgi:hypothetical protein
VEDWMKSALARDNNMTSNNTKQTNDAYLADATTSNRFSFGHIIHIHISNVTSMMNGVTIPIDAPTGLILV